MRSLAIFTFISAIFSVASAMASTPTEYNKLECTTAGLSPDSTMTIVALRLNGSKWRVINQALDSNEEVYTLSDKIGACEISNDSAVQLLCTSPALELRVSARKSKITPKAFISEARFKDGARENFDCLIN